MSSSIDQPKIAFLLMVHENPEQINLFLRQLLAYEHSEIYIHVDLMRNHIKSELLTDNRIHILEQSIHGKWGDYAQIEMIDLLLRYSYSQGPHDYYSLHSGCDLAIRPVKEYAAYLTQMKRYAYYYGPKLPRKDWGHGGGLERLALTYPPVLRKKYPYKHPMRYLRALYQTAYEHGILKGKPLPEKYQFCGGSEWFTISEEAVVDYVNFLEQHPDYDALFQDALAGDEIYHLSIFHMMKKDRLVENENNLRYIDWSIRNSNPYAGSPSICEMEFVHEIEESGAFFARKFDSRVDKEIIEYFLNKTLTAQQKLDSMKTQ